ncbi:MAG TPA: DUF2235 domain-containing protein [Hyphomicrobiaceae bacterium]|nr:DUF2235 domain-containing protein [Hyphomicrobiaceae bacterium]
MKRLVICYDGTWNAVTKPDEVTNVVRMAQAVKSVASDDVEQVVYYNAGVGSGGPLDQFLGGVFGVGLRNNVKRGLAFLSLNWDPQEPGNPVADEIYIFGFSRGAYSARALAGVIGAIGGIPKQSSFDELEEIWNHYRKSEEEKERDKEEDAKKIASWIYPMAVDRKPIIKCLGVWDTVGSYGIPAGLGLGALARKLTSWTRGFHDNEIGDEIEYGLQAMAIDEARRSFPATAWVTQKAEDRRGVEQVWFAGAHSNVGGGYKECGLSDLALIWMIARVRDQTGLQFDEDYIKEHFWPCAACSLYRSNRGWLISALLPFRRPIPEHSKRTHEGVERLINDKVHWSVRDRLGKVAIVDEHKYFRYAPKNLPKRADIVPPSETEMRLIALCRGSAENKKKQGCALNRQPPVGRQAWLERWRSRRFRRFRKEWAEDEVASA